MGMLSASPADFLAQVKAAEPGDVVQLTPGTYPSLVFKSIEKAEPGVTVVAVDAGVELPQGCELHDCVNLTLQGLTFCGVSERSGVNACAYVLGGEGVSIIDVTMANDRSRPLSERACGVFIKGTKNSMVAGCDISEVAFGISHLANDGLTINGNDVHHLYCAPDGIRGIGNNLRITHNRGWSFYQDSDYHPDFIQLWVDDCDASPHDILVEGNEWRQMDGVAAQGIFCGGDESLPYVNLVIRNNCIAGAQYNGIITGAATDALIENNLVYGFADSFDPVDTDKLMVPRLGFRNCSDGRLLNNRAGLIWTYECEEEGITHEGNEEVPAQPPGDYSLSDEWLAAQGGEETCEEKCARLEGELAEANQKIANAQAALA